jgi:NADH-quinone oxidoreductase subunit N
MSGLSPLIALGATAIALMLAASVRRGGALPFAIAALGLAASFGLLFAPAPPVAPGSFFAPDGYARLFIGLILIAALSVAAFSAPYLERRDPRARREEFCILLVLASLGAAALVAARHFLAFFLGLELLSVSLYALIAFPRREAGIEAAIKYLVLAGASSAFLLFGMALLYARTGTLDLAEIGQALAGCSAYARAGAGAACDATALAGVALLMVGFGFKLGVVPFHMWTPDVYQGAPAPVTAFVATASKGAVAALLLRYAIGLGLVPGAPLATLLAWIAGASMIAGNLLALRQTSLKRLLAYSSIAHLGYLLTALVAGGPLAARAVGFYLIAYTATTLAAFGVIASLSRGGDPGGDHDALDEYRGLGRRDPARAAILALALLSLASLPLTAGFAGKFLIVAAGVAARRWALVVLLAAGSAIGIFYYLRVAGALYLRDAPEGETRAPRRATPIEWLTLATLALAIAGGGIAPGLVLRLLRAASSVF